MEQNELLAKVVKQNCELHYLMGRLRGAYHYTETHDELINAIDFILTEFTEMKGVDE